MIKPEDNKKEKVMIIAATIIGVALYFGMMGYMMTTDLSQKFDRECAR
jgi:hypothetical protein